MSLCREGVENADGDRVLRGDEIADVADEEGILREVLSILDPDDPYRYIRIRGWVEHVTEEGASAHIGYLAKKYLGKDKYSWAQPGQVGVTFEIEPTAVPAQGGLLSHRSSGTALQSRHEGGETRALFQNLNCLSPRP